MIRTPALMACLVLTVVACDAGVAPPAPPSPAVAFSPDLIRTKEWEIYHQWAGRIAEVVAEVVDEDGQPYAGATVSVIILPRMEVLPPLVIAVQVSDEKGEVRFEDVPGNAFLRMEADGFAGGMLDLQFAMNPDFGSPKMPLRRGSEVSGRVLLPDGTPAPGVRVIGMSSVRDWYELATADEDGRYRLYPVPAGQIMLMAIPGGPIGQLPPFDVPTGLDVTRDLSVRALSPIHGRVLDANTGKPVAGAIARSFVDRDVLVVADDEGRFTLENVYGRMIDILAPGYAERSVPVDAMRADAIDVEVKLAPGVTARGVVVDEEGAPRAGARVFAVVDVEGVGRYVLGPLTDELGRFVWSWIEPARTGGKIVFGAEGAGLLPVVGSIHPLVPGISIDDIVLTLPEPSRLRFRLIDEQGEPLVDAVCLAEPDLEAVPSGVRPMVNTGGTAVTAEDGSALMAGLRRGPHFLSILLGHRIPFSTGINVGPGMNDLGDITVPDLLAIAGQVLSTGGELPDMVKAFLSIPGESFQAEVRIGKDGKFRISGLADRQYVLQLAASDHRTVTKRYAAGTEDIQVRLTLLGKLSVTPLLEGDDQPEGRIEMVRVGGAEAPVMRFFNRPGEAVMANRMTPGDWFVRVKAGEYYGAAKVTVIGGKSESVQVQLHPGGTIHGFVRKPDGTPAKRIGVQYDGGEAWGVHGVPVGDDGQYRLVGVPAGEVELLTHPRGFVPFRKTIVVINGEETRQDIELDAGGRFELRVTDPDGKPLSAVKVGLADDQGVPARYWISGQDRARTDEDGVLTLTGVPPGSYRLSLHIKDQLWESRQVDIPAGESKLVIEIDR